MLAIEEEFYGSNVTLCEKKGKACLTVCCCEKRKSQELNGIK